MQRKLSLNGNPVPVIANQMIFDLSDIDFGILVDYDREVNQDADKQLEMDLQPKARVKPRCECGSWAIGVNNYMPGHSSYCPVSDDKTPWI